MYQVRTKFPPAPKPAKAANSAKAQNGDLKSIPGGPAKAANVDRAGFSNFSGFSGYPEGEKKGGTGFSGFNNFSGLPEREKNTPSPVSILRRAGLVPVLAGDAFEVLGLENLPEDRQEKCVWYYTAHRKEILSELRHEEWYWKVFHLSWLRDAGLELSWDGIGQVTWKILPAFERIWNLGPERIVDHAFICWRYVCKHRREIMAALQPCRGWKPSQPSGGCTTLEESTNELEKERRRGVLRYCPFLKMWIAVKDCPRWCGKWNEPLTDAEREYWGAALWKNEKPSAA